MSMPKRARIFIATEGEGDRALVRWLQQLCDAHGSHLHLDAVVAGGGDTRSVVEFAMDRRRRHIESRGRDVAALVLRDPDRLDQDLTAGRNPATVAGVRKLRQVYLRPNLEGLLYRLHEGHEAQFPEAKEARQRLKKLWPENEKPMPASALSRRFDLRALQRVARQDTDLRHVLTLSGLRMKL